MLAPQLLLKEYWKTLFPQRQNSALENYISLSVMLQYNHKNLSFQIESEVFKLEYKQADFLRIVKKNNRQKEKHNLFCKDT